MNFSIQNGDVFGLQISKQMKMSFLISQPKPMLLVLKRTVSMRQSLSTQSMFELRFENNHKFTLIKFAFLNFIHV